MTEREMKMREKLKRIERDLVTQKRLRRQKRARGESIKAEDVEIAKLKIAAGRIRAHLERRFYG